MKTYQKILMQLALITAMVTTLKSQELTVYVLPSPLDRTWESPREIIVSTLKNMIYPEQYKKRFIGHVFIQLSNGDENFITGSAASADTDLKSLVLTQGYGLGVLNANIKGRLEDSKDLSYELAMRFKHGNVSFLRFRISPEMYDRLKYYMVEYDKRDYDTIYNGQNKPREGKGAGCSAFAVSFLEVAGFLKKDWEDNWMKRTRIPLELIGNKITGYKVSALKVIRSNKWARKDQPHLETCFYDPNFMHHWILDQFVSKKDPEARPVKINKAVGLEYDYSNRNCPEEAIFIQELTNAIVAQ